MNTSVGPDRVRIEFGEVEGEAECFLCAAPLLAGETSYIIQSTDMKEGLGLHSFCFLHLFMTLTEFVKENGLPSLAEKEVIN